MMDGRAWPSMRSVADFLLHHRHAPEECGASFAAWRGFPSPLRGGHERTLDDGDRLSQDVQRGLQCQP